MGARKRLGGASEREAESGAMDQVYLIGRGDEWRSVGTDGGDSVAEKGRAEILHRAGGDGIAWEAR